MRWRWPWLATGESVHRGLPCALLRSGGNRTPDGWAMQAALPQGLSASRRATAGLSYASSRSARSCPMRHFVLSRAMTNMRGVFYPTGHMVLMFPTEQDAEKAAELLRQDGLSEDDLCVAAPEE